MVNGRVVDGGIIADAVNTVFANYMTVGNFPFFVINLEVDLTTVDVNVHPRKAQVKFSNPQQIFEMVKHAVSGALDAYLQKKHSVNFDTKKDSELLQRLAFFQDGNNDDFLKQILYFSPGYIQRASLT
jgi:DNA mismatch repair protein MutL